MYFQFSLTLPYKKSYNRIKQARGVIDIIIEHLHTHFQPNSRIYSKSKEIYQINIQIFMETTHTTIHNNYTIKIKTTRFSLKERRKKKINYLHN